MVLLLSSPLLAEEAKVHLAKMASDLIFLQDKEGVPADIQAKIAMIGYTDMAVFPEVLCFLF